LSVILAALIAEHSGDRHRMAMPNAASMSSTRVQQPARYYTGVTSDVHARLKAHNGKCSHTAKARPRELDVVITFPMSVARWRSNGI
jgi:hypothetical protein